MRTDTAISLIDNLIVKPGFAVKATPNEHRFEGSIVLCVTYDAYSSDREHAPGYGQKIEGGAKASRTLLVKNMRTNLELYRAIVETFAAIDCHEHREFLRDGVTLEAPFHPHTCEGMEAWGDPNGDLTFGLAG